jgi:hypothetical protein
MDYLRCVGPGEVAFRGGTKPAAGPEVEGDGGVEAWAERFVADAGSVKQFVLERGVVNLDVDCEFYFFLSFCFLLRVC